MDKAASGVSWPDGKRFAFTVVDDTDRSTVENVGPVYDLLTELGIFTTKTVWPLSAHGKPKTGGLSLEDPGYRAWVHELEKRGFEIAIHGAADETSTRERIVAAWEYFREVMGKDPRLHANHTGQREAIYWGKQRLDGVPRLIYQWAWKLTKGEDLYYGDTEGSPHFWGDICRDRVEYVRNLVFDDINTLKCDPLMPYHDPKRPFVRYWFSSSEAPALGAFKRLLADANQDRLVAEGGACIVYTHFASGFWQDGRLDEEFVRLMRRLATLPGWFVPASELLDYLGEQRGRRELSDGRQELSRMQWKWLSRKLFSGRT